MPPPTSKLVTVTTSANTDKGIIRILNRNTGDVWTATIETDTAIFDLANNNIWGDEPTQWTNGDVLEIIALVEGRGGTTHTLTDGLNEPLINVESDTAFRLEI